jgi:hypothetical protein
LQEYVGHVNASKIENYNGVNSGGSVQSREENEAHMRGRATMGLETNPLKWIEQVVVPMMEHEAKLVKDKLLQKFTRTGPDSKS